MNSKSSKHNHVAVYELSHTQQCAA